MNGLIESTRVATLQDGWTGRAWSFALHSAAVAAALVATRPQPPAPPDDRRPTPLIWNVPDAARPPAPTPLMPGAPVIADPAVPLLVVPPVTPLSIADPPRPVFGTFDPPPGIVPPIGFAPTDPGTTPVMDVRYVEQLPVLVRHPALRYPALLQRAGIEGELLVEAVLDTTGAVERASLRVVQGGHPLFEAEALALVAGSRYRPARANGRAVRVRVQVPVRFSLRR